MRVCPALLIQVTYERSVTWTKVSLKEAKMRATPKTSSPVKRLELAMRSRGELGNADSYRPSLTWGPSEMFSVTARSTFFLGAIFAVGCELAVRLMRCGWLHASKFRGGLRKVVGHSRAKAEMSARATSQFDALHLEIHLLHLHCFLHRTRVDDR